MSTKRLKVIRKHRENPNALPALEDFDYVTAGEIAVKKLLNNPFANLYALDFPSQFELRFENLAPRNGT